jgi:Copper type II ascorbate-dependent monooxygenase, C-terminal domain
MLVEKEKGNPLQRLKFVVGKYRNRHNRIRHLLIFKKIRVKKSNIFVFTLLMLGTSSRLHGQALTFYKDIQPILLKHCAGCHRAGQIGPFPLITYEDATKRATFIKEVTQEGYMPPWHADTAFQIFHNQRILPQADIQKIAAWVDQGKKKGKAPKRNLAAENLLLDTARYPQPDLTFEMSREFSIPGDNTEQFRIFVIPTDLPEDVYIYGVEFMPGNRKLAHHCRVMVDTTNLLRADDGIAVGAASEFERTGAKLYDNFWSGWVPGNTPVFYPPGIAKKLPRRADLIINMHYSPTPVPATDRSKIRLYLAPKPPLRPIQTFILDEQWITNQPFALPANRISKFYMRSPVIPTDIYLFSALPHMHKLGKNFKSYAITPAGDLIPLIKIDRWDFNWQTTYQFKTLLKIPKGSVVYAEAEYDNTSNNPANPNFPPKPVTYGWGTNLEMMNLIFEYVE